MSSFLDLDDDDFFCANPSNKLVPVISLTSEETCTGVIKRLHYDHAGLAKLAELLVVDPSTSDLSGEGVQAAGGCEFDAENGIQLASLRQHHIICHGIWGGRQDIREFMMEHHGFSAVALRLLDTLPAGLYCCKSPHPDSDSNAIEMHDGPLVRLTLMALPVESGNANDFIHHPVNTLLLRFIHELASQKICLFDQQAKESFHPDLFPYDQEEEMPVYDLQVSMERGGGGSIEQNDYATVSHGISMPLKDPRRDWKTTHGHFPACYSIQEAIRSLRTMPLVETVRHEDLPDWVKGLAAKWSLSLKFSTRREFVLFLRIVMPEEWVKVGLHERTNELRSIRRQQEDLLVSHYALTQENEARMAFDGLIHSLLKHAWSKYAKRLLPSVEILDLEEAKDRFRESIGLIDAEMHIQEVGQCLNQDVVHSLAKSLATRRAEAQAIREIFFKGREKTVMEILDERRAAGSLESYVENLRRHGTWGVGVLSFSFLWPTKSLKQVRERSVICFEKAGIASQYEAALKEQCHKLRHSRGLWDDSVQRKCRERQMTLGREAKRLDGEIRKALHQLTRLLIQSSAGAEDHERKMGSQKLEFSKIELLRGEASYSRHGASAAAAKGKGGDQAEYRIHYKVTELKAEVGLELLARRLALPHAAVATTTSSNNSIHTRMSSPTMPVLAHQDSNDAAPEAFVSRDEQFMIEPGRRVVFFRHVDTRLAILITSTSAQRTSDPSDVGAQLHVISLPSDAQGKTQAVRAAAAARAPQRALLHTFAKALKAVDLDEENGLLAVLSCDGDVGVYRFGEAYRRLTKVWISNVQDLFGKSSFYSSRTGQGRGAASNEASPPEAVGVLIAGQVDQVVVTSSTGIAAILSINNPSRPPQRIRAEGWSAQTRFLLSPTGPTLLAISPCHDVDSGSMKEGPASDQRGGNAAAAATETAAAAEESAHQSRFRLVAFALSYGGAERLAFGKEEESLPNDTQTTTTESFLMLPNHIPHDASFSIGWLGSQEHLIWWDARTGHLSSVVLYLPSSHAPRGCLVSGQSCHNNNDLVASSSTTKGGGAEEVVWSSNSRLDMLYELFDKFATEACLGDPLPASTLTVLVRGLPADGVFLSYLRRVIEALKDKAHKPMNKLQLTLKEADWSDARPFADVLGANKRVRSGHKWMTSLLCLLPLQIARIEAGQLRALRDGILMGAAQPGQEQTADSLAQRVRFSTYDLLLRQLRLPVTVISAIGAQSCGKSYLLNHLGGALFDVAGGRCTDGVWMTLRVTDGKIVVMLDLEGMGSLERTQQEDVLMGILAAALSDVTLFRCHYQLDRYTEQTFNRLSDGASKVRAWGPASLFRAALYMCLKDVQDSERQAVCAEFIDKLRLIQQQGGRSSHHRSPGGMEDSCGGGGEQSWIEATFGGSVRILPFSIFQHPAFFRDIATLRSTLFSSSSASSSLSSPSISRSTSAGKSASVAPPPRYPSGLEFLRLARIVLAKLDLTDWTPFGRDELMARIAVMQRALPSACLAGLQQYSPLVQEGSIGLTDMKGGLGGLGVVARGTTAQEEIPDSGMLDFDMVVLSSEKEALSRVARVVIKELKQEGEELWRSRLTMLGLPDAGLILGDGVSSTQDDDDDDKPSASDSHSSSSPEKASIANKDIHNQLVNILTGIYPPSPANALIWRNNLANFLEALVSRRIQRVNRWIYLNLTGTESISPGNAGAKLEATAAEQLADLEAKRSLCNVNRCCHACFAPCTLPAGHEEVHDCGSSHECGLSCTYCCQGEGAAAQCEAGIIAGRCNQLKGHDSDHSCGLHLCGKKCHLSEVARGCGGSCTKARNHVGECECSTSEQHYCKAVCSASDCRQPCNQPYGVPHERHDCGDQNGCSSMCSLCSARCRHEDHFHVEEDSNPHLCNRPHQCRDQCQSEGVCELKAVQVTEKDDRGAGRGVATQTFTEYREQKRRCGEMIEAGQLRHEGPCGCMPESRLGEEGAGGGGRGSDHFHQCPARCPQCGYYCEKAVDHLGVHDCQHGNVRNRSCYTCPPTSSTALAGSEPTSQLLDVDDEDTLERAESCEALCARLGRGHVHILPCGASTGKKENEHEGEEEEEGEEATCLAVRHCDGEEEGMARHEEHSKDGSKRDLIKHEAYCRLLGWRDWCSTLSASEREGFNCCPGACHHREHSRPLDTMPVHSHCLLPLWHAPLDPAKPLPGGYEQEGRHISVSGCLFACTHGRPPIAQHTTFIVNGPSALADDSIRSELGLICKDAEVGDICMGVVLEVMHQFMGKRVLVSPSDRVTMVVFADDKDDAITVLRNKKPDPRLVQDLLAVDRSDRAWHGLENCEGSPCLKAGLKKSYECLQDFRRRLSIRCFICGEGPGLSRDAAAFRILTSCSHVLCGGCQHLVEKACPSACPACMSPCSLGSMQKLEHCNTTRISVRLLQRPIFVMMSDTTDDSSKATLEELERIAQTEQETLPDCTCWKGTAGYNQCPSLAHRLIIHFLSHLHFYIYISKVWGPFGENKLVHMAEAAARGHGSLQHAAPDAASLRQALGNIWNAPEKTGRVNVNVGASSMRKRKISEEDLSGFGEGGGASMPESVGFDRREEEVGGRKEGEEMTIGYEEEDVERMVMVMEGQVSETEGREERGGGEWEVGGGGRLASPPLGGTLPRHGSSPYKPSHHQYNLSSPPFGRSGSYHQYMSSPPFGRSGMGRSSSDGVFSFTTPEKKQRGERRGEVIITRGKIFE